MTGFDGLPHDRKLLCLAELASSALSNWRLDTAVPPVLINLSENATYRVDDPATGSKWALRVHREGYHSLTAIASELEWLIARKASGAAITPTPIAGSDGELIQSVAHEDLPR